MLLNPNNAQDHSPAKTYLSPAVTHPQVNSQLWSTPPVCLHWVIPAAPSSVPLIPLRLPSPSLWSLLHTTASMSIYTSERVCFQPITGSPLMSRKLSLLPQPTGSTCSVSACLGTQSYGLAYMCMSQPALPPPNCCGNALRR